MFAIGFVKVGFNTPGGHAHVQYVKVAHQEDESAITLALLQHTLCHKRTNLGRLLFVGMQVPSFNEREGHCSLAGTK